MVDHQITVALQPDTQSMVGRECPRCHWYFKLKPGTGLPTDRCHCPYCGEGGRGADFVTEDQVEYALSVAKREVMQSVVEPSLMSLERSLKRLERSTRGSMFPVTAQRTSRITPALLHQYSEEDLETDVTCDSCLLEFAVFGVFASCPDCADLNVKLIFQKSVEVARTQVTIAATLSGDDALLQERLLSGAVGDGVSALDAAGKELRRRSGGRIRENPKNLFQNLDALADELQRLTGEALDDLLGPEDAAALHEVFQMRHIHEHNAGVADEAFVRRVPRLRNLLGRKVKLTADEVAQHLDIIDRCGRTVLARFESVIRKPSS